MYLTGQRKKCISFFIIGIMVFVTIAGAVISAPVCVYALSVGGLKGTIASLIISLLLQTGVAPTNQSFLNAINSSYGVESSIGTIEDMITNGLLTESGGTLIDTGLSTAIQNESVWTEWSLNEIFATTASESGVIASSGAVNLANTAINLGTGGTIGAFAGAVAIGVGVGVLANHVREYISNIVKYGFPMDMKTKQGLLSNIPSGFDRAYYVDCNYPSGNNVLQVVFTSGDVMCSAHKVSGSGGRTGFSSYFYTKNGLGANQSYKKRWTNSTLDQDMLESPATPPSMSPVNTLIETNIKPIFDTQSELNNYINAYGNNNNSGSGEIYSPDLIGNNGNMRYDYQNDDVPDIGNIVPDNHDMYPVDMEDYQNFVDQANENTEDGNVDQEQGTAFDEFVDPYFVNTDNQPIIPDTPVDIPTVPDRPIVPDQPTIPDKPDVTNEDIQQSLEGATTIDLRSVFPFCIPWDIYNLVLIFDTGEDREAPHITFTFPFNENWIIDIDLAEFDSAAAILRLLELIVFIVGLMVATRSLIGAKG